MEKLVLQGKEYDEIEETVNNLFEDLGYTQFPVDCFDLASKLKIDVKKYSDIQPEDRDMLIAKYEDGYGSCLGKFRYVIYYNDSLPDDRIRFTIWYEIGHIQLGHYDNCSKSQERMKAEANHFAIHAQAPMSAVILSNPQDVFDVSSTFNLSLECAANRYASYKKATAYPNVAKRILGGRILDILDFSKVKEIRDGRLYV